MGLEDYAKQELELLGSDDDPMQAEMNKDIMQVIKLFSLQGHSGFSAGYAISVIDRLLRWRPLTPLTGKDDEWNEVGEGTFQNNRCPSVFKDKTGSYDIGAVSTHYAGDNNRWSADVHYYVEFPYMCDKQLKLELPSEAREWSNEQQADYVREHRGDSKDMAEISEHLDAQ
ncbi:hypothetical protein [Lactiplantibacillus paraxiangfangensis]